MNGKPKRPKSDYPAPSLELFEKHWTMDQSAKAGLADFWDQRADSFNAHKKHSGSQQLRLELRDLITSRCRLTSGSRVLDIGCGSGQNAILLAEKGARVTGVDISARMIELASQNASQEGLGSDIVFEMMDWDTVDVQAQGWSRAFDLVLASRTPAINDRASLEKMMAVSRNYCLIISQVEQYNSIRESLAGLIAADEERVRAGRSFYCAFNVLWLSGCYPEIHYLDQAWEADLTVEDAFLVQSRYFEQSRPLSEVEKTALKERLSEMAVNGLIRERIRAKCALLFWQV